jgi:hypothetical protein
VRNPRPLAVPTEHPPSANEKQGREIEEEKKNKAGRTHHYYSYTP